MERIENEGIFYKLMRVILWKWDMPKKQICLFKSYNMPILRYGAETWTWIKAGISRQTTAEVRF
jgi:hypothetical protein